MTVSNNGITLIKMFEGYKDSAYLDIAGVPTIGYGHTAGVKLGDTCTEEQATVWLQQDLREATNCVTRMVDRELNQNQFDALVSFTYNEGCGRLQSSTMLRLINQGNFSAAAEEFPRWKFAGGKVSIGILNRRLAERKLFLTEISQ